MSYKSENRRMNGKLERDREVDVPTDENKCDTTDEAKSEKWSDIKPKPAMNLLVLKENRKCSILYKPNLGTAILSVQSCRCEMDRMLQQTTTNHECQCQRVDLYSASTSRPTNAISNSITSTTLHYSKFASF